MVCWSRADFVIEEAVFLVMFVKPLTLDICELQVGLKP